jgi:hypothetical protein
MTDTNITKDQMYGAVAPDDFESMIELDRYAQRSTAFDKIISATHAHFWDPLDKRYVDFDQPFDLENEALMPEEQMPLLNLNAISDKLDGNTRIRFVNRMQHLMFSTLLHGEQGAMSLSASLCHILKDQGAQEYAANQAREEARHVTAFAKYIQSRWGRPVGAAAALKALLLEIVGSPSVYKKIIGMQIILEGLAMGTFAHLYRYTRDPVARRMLQLVMTDEAFHHKFGKIWAERTVPELTQAERDTVEDWTAHCAQIMIFGNNAAEHMVQMFADFGIEPMAVMMEIAERRKTGDPRKQFTGGNGMARVLVQTLLKTGLITGRTRSLYAAYFDLDRLAADSIRAPGEDVAEEGIAYLQTINGGRAAE